MRATTGKLTLYLIDLGGGVPTPISGVPSAAPLSEAGSIAAIRQLITVRTGIAPQNIHLKSASFQAGISDEADGIGALLGGTGMVSKMVAGSGTVHGRVCAFVADQVPTTIAYEELGPSGGVVLFEIRIGGARFIGAWVLRSWDMGDWLLHGEQDQAAFWQDYQQAVELPAYVLGTASAQYPCGE